MCNLLCHVPLSFSAPYFYLLSIIRRPKSTVIMEIRLNQYLLDILCLISCLTRHTTEPRTNIEKVVVHSCLYSKGCCFSRNSISNSSSLDGVASKENEVVLEQDTTRSQTFSSGVNRVCPRHQLQMEFPPNITYFARRVSLHNQGLSKATSRVVDFHVCV